MTVNITLNDATPSALPDFVRTNNATTIHNDLEAVAQAVARARRIVVVCGAGISVASGIPDFRSSEGLFRTLKEENPKELLSSGKDLFDSSVFSVPERTVLFYKMIAQLASLSSSAAPSPFHHFLKALDERGQLLRLYTQNIDNLEEKAGLSCGVPSWPTTSKGTTVAQTPALDLPDARLSPSPSRLAPRCIPLHGTLKQLVCQRCAHAIPLENELETLAGGHSVACPQCASNGSMRRMEGKRDRGVGRMRPSVVLYGEDHLAGEGVGECVRRDLIGLGDVLSSSSSSSASSPSPPDAATGTPSKPPSAKVPAPRARASAQPDLLIVAGSSLKVPGTKRIVREFAKAVQATRTSAASSRSSTPGSQAPSSTKARNHSPSPTLKPTSNGSDKDDSERTLVDSVTPQSHSDIESSHSSYDLVAHPPRTIYLNLDFPVPTRDWKGVFDVWVQGDVQQLVDTFMNALRERDKNQGVAGPLENGKAKSRSRKRRPDAGDKEKSSSTKRRKVAADPTTHSGEESVLQPVKRKAPPSRPKVKKEDTDGDNEDASPEMVAARGLLALSVSPSSPTPQPSSSTRKKRHPLPPQSQLRTSTTFPPLSPTSRTASSPPRVPRVHAHSRSSSGSSVSHSQQPQPSLSYCHTHSHSEQGACLSGTGGEPPPMRTLKAEVSIPPPPTRAPPSLEAPPSSGLSQPARVQPGLIMRPNVTNGAVAHGYAASRSTIKANLHSSSTRSSRVERDRRKDVSSGSFRPTEHMPHPLSNSAMPSRSVSVESTAPASDLPISRVLPAKKRARAAKPPKTSGSLVDDIDIDPALLENGSAAMIRIMSLGLRDRAGPRDK